MAPQAMVLVWAQAPTLRDPALLADPLFAVSGAPAPGVRRPHARCVCPGAPRMHARPLGANCTRCSPAVARAHARRPHCSPWLPRTGKPSQLSKASSTPRP